MIERLIVKKRTSALSLIFASVLYAFTLGSSDFHLIRVSKTYNEAKSYCREMYTDLATVNDSADMNNLITLVSTTTARAWIGLETGDVWMWHWSLSHQKLDFFNWNADEPKENNQDACAAMDQLGGWFESVCGTRRNFVCHGNGDTSGHIFVDQTKSWRDAQSHCRGLSSDLVSIHSAEENNAVLSVSGSQNVWIGLFKDPWKWSDGSNSSFRFWKPSQPNYLEDQDCTTAVFRDGGLWNDLRCSGRRNFVCRGARKPIPTTTTTQETITTDPPTYLTTPAPTTSPPEVIVTIGFTVHSTTQQSNFTNASTTAATTASEVTTTNTTDFVSHTSTAGINNATTQQSDITTASTTAATTASEVTTTNTTDFVSHTSTTELNNATTEMSTVTTTQLPNTTSMNATTDSVSTRATVMTSTQSMTQSSTIMHTTSSHSLHAENLILIQKNMMWIEAMSYCRTHHVDLVHITSKALQDKVAEKAKNATSPHVWLGLRYTCKFKFWFWTTSTSACYQNWVPGQGSDGEYGCGVSGAIEATGGQQWVGLPETDRLNFICSV